MPGRRARKSWRVRGTRRSLPRGLLGGRERANVPKPSRDVRIRARVLCERIGRQLVESHFVRGTRREARDVAAHRERRLQLCEKLAVRALGARLARRRLRRRRRRRLGGRLRVRLRLLRRGLLLRWFVVRLRLLVLALILDNLARERGPLGLERGQRVNERLQRRLVFRRLLELAQLVALGRDLRLIIAREE